MNTTLRLLQLSILCLSALASCQMKAPVGEGGDAHRLPAADSSTVHEYFRYKADGSILVSGHRGGREKGFPENSIEGFENVLRQLPAFFEIDPRLTKDSVIVLMHDATLDRTTTASGRLADYTWDELQDVRLKDYDGRVTSCRIGPHRHQPRQERRAPGTHCRPHP